MRAHPGSGPAGAATRKTARDQGPVGAAGPFMPRLGAPSRKSAFGAPALNALPLGALAGPAPAGFASLGVTHNAIAPLGVAPAGFAALAGPDSTRPISAESLLRASPAGQIASLVTGGAGDGMQGLRRQLQAVYEIPRTATTAAAALAAVPAAALPAEGSPSPAGFGPVGLASSIASSRVVNGADVLTDFRGDMPYPWYAQLRVHRKSGGAAYSSAICGGSIIHAWPADAASRRPAGVWVVSAAHCLTDPTPGTYAVNLWAGTNAKAYSVVRAAGVFPVSSAQAATPNGDGAWLEISPARVQVFVHPLYDPATNHFDVALLRVLLPDGVQLPAPIFDGAAGLVRWERVARLPVTESPPQAAAVIGFGATSPGGAASHDLQYGAVRVEDPAVRQRITAHPAYTPLLNTWATGPTNAAGEAVDTCQGDSGGPLFAFEREFSEAATGQMAAGAAREVHTIHAVTSWGISCGVPTYPGVYAKLSPFIAPAAGAVAAALPASSPWRLGMTGMIDALSPQGFGYRAGAAATLPPPPPPAADLPTVGTGSATESADPGAVPLGGDRGPSVAAILGIAAAGTVAAVIAVGVARSSFAASSGSSLSARRR